MSQNTQEYAQQLLSKMVYPDMPADEGLRLVQTNIARFAYGGPVDAEEQEQMPEYPDMGLETPAFARGGEVQHLAGGGLPFTPTAMVRPSARRQLDEIKASYDQYNNQVGEYNTAADAYMAQENAYNAAVDAYNAGERTEDFTGVAPAAPPTAPVAPGTSVEQYEALGQKARTDVKNRNLALQVASDPRQFGLMGMEKFFADGGEVESMQGEARKGEAYQALEKYLQSRDQVPDIEVSRSLPEDAEGMFTSNNIGIGSGTIKIRKDSPKASRASLLSHEMTHAADRQMMQQAMEQGMFGDSNQYTEAYEKLVGKEGRNRTALARRLKPEWSEDNRYYRASPKEIAAYGVGAFAGPTSQRPGPRHVDATAATELQILLDLAQRNVDKGPTGLAKIPAALRKTARYSGGGDVQPSLTPQQIEQIAAQEALEREKASSPAFLTPKSGKGRQISTKPGELEGAALQGVSEMPYLLAGAPVDLATMAMRPFGYDVEKPMFGSDDLKQRALAAGIRQKPPEGAAARALYEMGQLGASVVNPAAPVRGAVAAAGRTGEAAKRLASDFQQYNQQISAPGASYAVPPQGRVMATAPASDLGFYSAAEQAALNLPRKEGPGVAFLNDLMKASDVKKEELEFMGLDAFLRGKPKVTREEVQDFISNNRIDVKEVQLGGNVVEDPAGLAKRKEVFDRYEPEILSLYKQMDAAPQDQPDLWSQLYGKATEIQRIRDREADAAYTIPEAAPTRFDRPTLVLPGGQNYREILLTLPKQSPKVDPADVKVLATGTNKVGGKPFVSFEFKGERYVVEKTASETDQQAISRRIEAIPGVSGANTFRSSHFDEPNILAHMRVNDRVDADGKKMLLIEEIQSDWHQAGREVGYRKGFNRDAIKDEMKQMIRERKALVDEFTDYQARYGEITPEMQAKWNEFKVREDALEQKKTDIAAQVPDAPFKDTWHQLALKRALKYAADNGYERVGLTTGKQQSQRYNMSQQVDHIGYEPTKKGFYINVISKDGPNVLNGDYSVKELEGIVGKELTQKMLAKEGKNEFNPEIEPDLAEVRRLDGVDLQLEDKGMKKYYDEIYPAFLAKQAKKYGAQVGETRIKTGRGVPGGESVRFVDITPEMQGAVPYAKGGAVERQPSDNRRYL